MSLNIDVILPLAIALHKVLDDFILEVQQEKENISSHTDIQRPLRKAHPSKISTLDMSIREHVDMMLRSDSYTYQDVQYYLKGSGVIVSNTSLCRYQKHLRAAK